MNFFTSIAGNKVEINSDDKLYKYRKDTILPLVKCPITTEYFDDPVLLHYGKDSYPYERSAITKWFRSSNVEPMTGESINDKFKIVQFNLLKFIINCLEEKNDCFIFHSPKTNHVLVEKIMQIQNVGFKPQTALYPRSMSNRIIASEGFPIDGLYHFSAKNLMTHVNIVELAGKEEFKNSIFCLYDFSEFLSITGPIDKSMLLFKDCKFVDCLVPDSLKTLCENCTFTNALHNFSLEEFLIFDRVKNVVILSDQTINMFGQITSGSSINIDKYIRSFTSQIAGNMRINRIYNNYNLQHYRYFYLYPNSNKKLNITTQITPVSNSELVLKNANTVKKLLETDEEIERGYNIIQKYVDKHDEITREVMDGVKDMQIAMDLPRVYDDTFDWAGMDFSFLNLAGKRINVDPLKYDSFCYANLNGATFVYHHFCNTNFSFANLLNTDFKHGSFCPSHLPIFNGTKINVHTINTIKPEYLDYMIPQIIKID